MFTKLFAENGLSLERLKAFLEVGANGSIAKAVPGDPVKQSQYSRQIKELENFFRIKLIERHGNGIRLTSNGRELARISRFFLLGLSNFQRGCLAEEQSFRIGAGATFIRQCLLPVLAAPDVRHSGIRYMVETTRDDDEIERRLHDLSLDFGVVTRAAISRPLQLMELSEWRLKLWVPRKLHKTGRSANQALQERRLPLVFAERELNGCVIGFLDNHERQLVCDNFLEAMTVMEQQSMASVLPDFLKPPGNSKHFFSLPVPELDTSLFHFRLAWNPRLMRLNPHAVHTCEFLHKTLMKEMSRMRRTQVSVAT